MNGSNYVYPNCVTTVNLSRDTKNIPVILTVTMSNGSVITGRQYAMGKAGLVTATGTGGKPGYYNTLPSHPTIMGNSSGTNENCGGYISECIYYQSLLTNTQIQLVESYLAWKWGFQTNFSGCLETSNTYTAVIPYNRPVAVPSTDIVIYGTPSELLRSFGTVAQWLDAYDPLGTGTPPGDGNSVSTWFDKSGNGWHMLRDTAIAPYTTSSGTAYYRSKLTDSTPALNKPAIDFKATPNTRYLSAPFTVSQNVTLFMVGVMKLGAVPTDHSTWWAHLDLGATCNFFNIRRSPGTSYGGISWNNKNFTICGGNGTGSDFFPGAGSDDTSFDLIDKPFLMVATMKDGSIMTIKEYIMGQMNPISSSITYSYYPTTPYPTNNKNTRVAMAASGSGGNISSYINEVIYYQEVLPESAISTIESYLAWKWGFQTAAGGSLAMSHPYSLSFPTVPAEIAASAATASAAIASAAIASAAIPSAAIASAAMASAAEASGQMASVAVASAAEASGQMASAAYASGQKYSGAFASGQQASAAYASGQMASAAYASGQMASAAYASGQKYSGAFASGQQASAAYASGQMASAAYASGQMASAAYASGQKYSGAFASGQYASGQQASAAYASGQQFSGAFASGQRASAATASAAYASGQRASAATASAAYASGQRASGQIASGQQASAATASGQMASAARASAATASTALGIKSMGQDPDSGEFLLLLEPL
jgi:hypothetical protein